MGADVVYQGLGYSGGAKANLMTVPPYVIGTIVLLIFAYLSDHFRTRVFRSRVFPILGGLAIVLIGLITVNRAAPLQTRAAVTQVSASFSQAPSSPPH